MKNESGKDKSNYKMIANNISNFIKQLLFLFLKRKKKNSIMNYFFYLTIFFSLS